MLLREKQAYLVCRTVLERNTMGLRGARSGLDLDAECMGVISWYVEL